MCRQIAEALGTGPVGHYSSLVRAIEARLKAGFEDAGLRQVIMIDDAHELRPEVLKLIRLLTNFEMDSKLVVSIILSGQLPLKEILHRPDMEDVKQRLARTSEIRLLSLDETRSYIEHRVKIAGAQRSPFDDGAPDSIFEITRGNMRAIDKIATACLLEADKASRDTISSSDVANIRSKLWM
jgi:type II secretory pathway predicted ATPase ExeA